MATRASYPGALCKLRGGSGMSGSRTRASAGRSYCKTLLLFLLLQAGSYTLSPVPLALPQFLPPPSLRGCLGPTVYLRGGMLSEFDGERTVNCMSGEPLKLTCCWRNKRGTRVSFVCVGSPPLTRSSKQCSSLEVEEQILAKTIVFVLFASLALTFIQPLPLSPSLSPSPSPAPSLSSVHSVTDAVPACSLL